MHHPGPGPASDFPVYDTWIETERADPVRLEERDRRGRQTRGERRRTVRRLAADQQSQGQSQSQSRKDRQRRAARSAPACPAPAYPAPACPAPAAGCYLPDTVPDTATPSATPSTASVQVPSPRTRMKSLVATVLILALAAMAGLPSGASAQAPGDPDAPPAPRTTDRGELRVGLSLGGTGFLSFVTEYKRGGWGAELTLGTITFREIAAAISGKRYFMSGTFQPVVGLGLWSLTAWTEDGSGSVLIVRAPLAVEWNVTGTHATGIEVGLNRAIAVNRLDPEDDTPPNRTLVPIPGVYYRYGWRP